MAKKPPSAYKKDRPKRRTTRDWAIISVYIILAIMLVVPLVASLFSSTAGHGGY